ncbi:MAG: TraX family protein [Clostridia bacterium]|nr:TraX family protein [Clostridia bacterium]
MSAFVLKIIALLAMLLDHIGYVFWEPGDSLLMLFRYIGRIAFPIFAFQIAQGYVNTKNIYKYGLRLLILAVVSQLPFFALRHGFVMPEGMNWLGLADYIYIDMVHNICFTLLFGLFAIYVYDKLGNFPKYEIQSKAESKFYNLLGWLLRIAAVVSVAFLARGLGVEFGFFGVLLVVGFYAAKNNRIKIAAALVCYAVLYFLRSNIQVITSYPELIAERLPFYFCSLFALIPIYLYDPNKRGFKCRWLTYAFYPVHMLLIAIVDALIG